MQTVTFTVNKANVYDEVAKTTAYTGAKAQDEKVSYERIFATDEDRLALERFWAEASNAVTDLFKPFLTSVTSQPEGQGVDITRNFVAVLEISGSYDTALNDSIGSSLFSFFSLFIVGKWFKYTNKDDAASYANEAAGMLEDVKSKIYYRKKPRRVAPTE